MTINKNHGIDFSLHANPIEQHLQKPSKDFSREDLIRFVREQGIRMVNFRYPAEDGKLKILNFIIQSEDYLRSILTTGERVDGSSLFSYIEAGSSDLYVVPRYSTAFVNPFSQIPAVDILCSFYNNKSEPLETAPEHILRKAHQIFKKDTGFTLKAMGELEYYVQGKKEEMYPAEDQKGYHLSTPFSNYESFRTEAMNLIARCGGRIKYGHSEVGIFSSEAESFEQHEIEFLPVDVEDAADQLVIAKWVLRHLGDQYGLNVSFAPKITVGKAGSGMHIHMYLEKDGRNVMVDQGRLSDDARRLIAGLMHLAAPLTAFGNTIPTSYLRLVPHQEAPTNVCWGDRNRSVLVRVPLGWLEGSEMIYHANPLEPRDQSTLVNRQTVELRSPDGSADIYHLLAGILVAARHGLQMPEALELAERLYVDVNIFHKSHQEKLRHLAKLPTSCSGSADILSESRAVFEKDGIFPPGTIDSFIRKLKSYQDEGLSERLYGKTEEIRKLVYKYLHHM